MSDRVTGILISLEGGEGVGKSTAIDKMKQWLHHHCPHRQVITTLEPGGCPKADQVRDMVLHPKEQQAWQPLAELLLIYAARHQHIHEVIKPHLDSGSIVICDRFFDASFAYQGAGKGVENTIIEQVNHWVCEHLQPDLTLLFDAPVAISAQRLAHRTKDTMESNDTAFFQRVRQCYLERAQQEPQRIHVIDAEQSLADVEQQVINRLSNLLNK